MPIRLHSRHKYRAREQSKLLVLVKPSAAALAARDDLAAFGEFISGKVAADIHRSWFPYLITNQDSECLNRVAGDNVNLLSFRGSAKTTWARLWIAWVIGHNPHIQIGWISYNEATALKSSRVIKRIIEHPRYQEVFPWVRAGRRWADTDWEIDKKHAGVTALDADFTLVALGITGGITSNRFHLAVYDDLIKSSQQIKSEDIRAKMAENYGEVIEPCLEAVPGSRQVSLGTRFRGDDIHSTEFTAENDWRVIEQGAIVLDEQGQERSAWERIPLERLLKIRRRRPVIFSYQWMNRVPPPSDEQSIQAEWIQYCDPEEIPNFVELVLGVDLAASEGESGDFTAFVLGGRTRDRIFLLEPVELKVKGNMKKIREIMQLWKRWKHKAPRLRVVFGKGAYQNSFEGDWEEFRRKQGVNSVVCEGVPERADKDEKLESISGVFEDRIVYLNRAKDWGRTVAQLLRTDLDNDDLADGSYFCLSKLQKRARRPLSAA